MSPRYRPHFIDEFSTNHMIVHIGYRPYIVKCRPCMVQVSSRHRHISSVYQSNTRKRGEPGGGWVGMMARQRNRERAKRYVGGVVSSMYRPCIQHMTSIYCPCIDHTSSIQRPHVVHFVYTSSIDHMSPRYRPDFIDEFSANRMYRPYLPQDRPSIVKVSSIYRHNDLLYVVHILPIPSIYRPYRPRYRPYILHIILPSIYRPYIAPISPISSRFVYISHRSSQELIQRP